MTFVLFTDLLKYKNKEISNNVKKTKKQNNNN